MRMGAPASVAVAVLLGAALLVLVAVSWQHLRYLHARRQLVQDHQPMLYAPSAFHVVTLGKLAPGADLFTDAKRLVAAIEAGGGRVVYAGKCLLTGLESQQLPPVAWDFALLSQYPSRETYDEARVGPEVADARAMLARAYDLGMRRSALLNLSLPIVLLARRAQDVLTRHPARYPFQRAADFPASVDPAFRERARGLVAALSETQGPGRDAAVVVNFVKHGTPEERAQDAGYVGEMLGLMAEQGHGPMHMGSAVSVEGDARFDQVALVYYPGAPYFAEMVQSTFYGRIMGGKQLGDSLAVITAPFLDRL